LAGVGDGADQAPEHGREGADRAGVGLGPAAGRVGEGVAGPDGPVVEHDRGRQHPADLAGPGRRAEPRPAGVGAEIGGPDDLAAGVRVDAGAFAEVALGLLEGLLGLVGGGHPAQRALPVGQHQPDPVGAQQRDGGRDDLVERLGQAVPVGFRPVRRGAVAGLDLLQHPAELGGRAGPAGGRLDGDGHRPWRAQAGLEPQPPGLDAGCWR
jgi:hypothetical protein